MNNGAIIGGVIVLLVIVIAGAYLLSGSPAKGTVSSTVAVTPSNSTTTVSTQLPVNSVVPSNATTSNVTSYSQSYAVQAESNSTYGAYLASSTGYTLYVDTADVQYSGTSTCTSGCATLWPPFYTSNLVLGSGLNASQFAIINRTGTVSQQVTYKGWPLYLYQGDSKPGVITGNGVADFVVATK